LPNTFAKTFYNIKIFNSILFYSRNILSLLIFVLYIVD
jgi:hypothetical protein